MDDTLEVPLTRGSEGSDARGSRILSHEFPQLVQLLCASWSCGRSTSQTTTQRARVLDHLGSELFTILDMSDVALGMMAAISMEEKVPATYVVSAVVEHLRAWRRKEVIFRIDGEPAIRALGVAIQHARSEETVIECRPKYSSPSMGQVENMNKEFCGPVRCLRIHLREKASWRSRLSLHSCCGKSELWISSRNAVRADGRTGWVFTTQRA